MAKKYSPAQLLAMQRGKNRHSKKVVSAAAQELGHFGGVNGGPARAAVLSSKQMSQIARHAANKRWNKPCDICPYC